MEYILLLTACINPDGMPFTCLADVGSEKETIHRGFEFLPKKHNEKNCIC